MPALKHGISIEHEVYLGAIKDGVLYTINPSEAHSVLGNRGNSNNFRDGSFGQGIELTQGAGSSPYKNLTVDEAVEDLQNMEKKLIDKANEGNINVRLRNYKNRYGEFKKWPYGAVTFKPNSGVETKSYAGSYHVHFSLPDETQRGIAYENKLRKAAKFIQWVEPLFMAVFGAPDPRAPGSKGKYVESVYRAISTGWGFPGATNPATVGNTRYDGRNKGYITKIRSNFPGYTSIGSAWSSSRSIYSDIRLPSEVPTLELRFLDSFSSNDLRSSIKMFTLSIIASRTRSSTTFSDALSDTNWNKAMMSILKEGWNAILPIGYINKLKNIFGIKWKKKSRKAYDVYGYFASAMFRKYFADEWSERFFDKKAYNSDKIKKDLFPKSYNREYWDYSFREKLRVSVSTVDKFKSFLNRITSGTRETYTLERIKNSVRIDMGEIWVSDAEDIMYMLEAFKVATITENTTGSNIGEIEYVNITLAQDQVDNFIIHLKKYRLFATPFQPGAVSQVVQDSVPEITTVVSELLDTYDIAISLDDERIITAVALNRYNQDRQQIMTNNLNIPNRVNQFSELRERTTINRMKAAHREILFYGKFAGSLRNLFKIGQEIIGRQRREVVSLPKGNVRGILTQSEIVTELTRLRNQGQSFPRSGNVGKIKLNLAVLPKRVKTIPWLAGRLSELEDLGIVETFRFQIRRSSDSINRGNKIYIMRGNSASRIYTGFYLFSFAINIHNVYNNNNLSQTLNMRSVSGGSYTHLFNEPIPDELSLRHYQVGDKFIKDIIPPNLDVRITRALRSSISSRSVNIDPETYVVYALTSLGDRVKAYFVTNITRMSNKGIDGYGKGWHSNHPKQSNYEQVKQKKRHIVAGKKGVKTRRVGRKSNQNFR